MNDSPMTLFQVPPGLTVTCPMKVRPPVVVVVKLSVPEMDVLPVTFSVKRWISPVDPLGMMRLPCTFSVPVADPCRTPPCNTKSPAPVAPTVIVRPAVQFAIPMTVRVRQPLFAPIDTVWPGWMRTVSVAVDDGATVDGCSHVRPPSNERSQVLAVAQTPVVRLRNRTAYASVVAMARRPATSSATRSHM